MYNFDDQHSLFDKVSVMYSNSPHIVKWSEENVPSSELCWSDGVENQKQEYCTMANNLGIPVPRVVSTHISKSVTLPVVAFSIPSGFVISRNNFYDVKGVFILNYIPDKSLHDIMLIPSTEEYLQDQKKRCIKYDKHTGNEDKYKSDAWMQDWSGDQVIRYKDKIYIASGIHSVYFEGINKILNNDAFSPYDINKSTWAASFHAIIRNVDNMYFYFLEEAIASLL